MSEVSGVGSQARDAVGANPLRRFGAIVYDTLLVIAVEIVATLPFVPFMHGKVLVASEAGALAYVYRAWQCAVMVVFLGWFWTRKGRTLGMQAWRLRMIRVDRAPIGWRDALLRMLWACVPWAPGFVLLTAADAVAQPGMLRTAGEALLVLGFLNYCVAWLDPQRRSWHDRFLQTRVIKSP